jgi:2-desacetyl-2-hydroxyethyl bacteriochlorophyllide A dehydrogenase
MSQTEMGMRAMKQIVLEAPGRFAEREAVAPGAEAGHALIRMKRVGVCGSDFHAFAGRHPVYTYPRVIGHELSGVVVDAPPNDFGIQAGDRCAIEPYMTCGTCRSCRQAKNNCCEQIRLLGIHVDGGMQELLSVPLGLVHKSATMSLDQLALVETLGIGAHAVLRSGLADREEAMIIGAGPIGIAVAQFVLEAGARVHLVERSEWRRHFVEQLGYSASSTPDGREASVVFDATGSAISMAASLTNVSPGGRLVFVGLTSDRISIDDSIFHRKELTLLASRNSFGLFPRIIRLIENGKIDTSHWVTDRLKLSEVASQFGTLPERKTLIKAMVDLDEL